MDSIKEHLFANADAGPRQSKDPFEIAVRATRTPMVITDPTSHDNPIVYVNDAFLTLTGYEREEILGRNCRFLQGPETNSDDLQKIRRALAARQEIETDLLNYRKDGTTFWNRLLISPVFDGDTLTFFTASQQDVTLEREDLVRLEQHKADLEAEVAQRSEDLEASEQRLRFALEAGNLGVWTIDLLSGELMASAACKAICGRTPDEALSLEALRASIHPEDRLLQVEAIEQAIREHSLLDAEYRLITPGGDLRWVQIRGQAAYGSDGTPLSITGTTQDVTVRRQAQSQRALLARELSHRVKNTLASLQAVVAQTIRRSTSLKDAGATIAARIQAMAAANDLLISEDFGDASMRELIERTLAPFGVEDQLRFKLSGPEVKLPSQAVVACALSLHELATNATKYGALSNDKGQVTICWALDDKGPQTHLELVWRESGGPTVSVPAKTSFGTLLIQRLLVSEMGGSAEITYPPEGISFTATVPLS